MMLPPVEINLPSGLRIMMFPRPARYRWWPWAKIEDGETEAELYQRFAQAIRQVDFKSIADLYDPPSRLQDLLTALAAEPESKPKARKGIQRSKPVLVSEQVVESAAQ